MLSAEAHPTSLHEARCPAVPETPDAQGAEGASPLASASSTAAAAAGSSATPVACPHCGGRLQKHGFFTRKDGCRQQRYLCTACRRTSSPTTGTLVSCLKKHGEWHRMCEQMRQELSLRQMAAALGVHLSTAFRWRHRLLHELCRQPHPPLEGEVSVTHVYIPYSEKGSRTGRGPGSWRFGSASRHGLQIGPKPRFRRFIDGRPTCVLLAQAKAEHASVLLGSQRLGSEHLESGLRQLVAPGASLYLFGCGPYAQACQHLGLRHHEGRQALHAQLRAVAVEGKECRRLTIREPQTPYAWMLRFRGVATRYLHHYMAWFSSLVQGVLAKGWPDIDAQVAEGLQRTATPQGAA